MRDYIRSLSERTEFLVVVFSAFGYFIVVSIFDAFSPDKQVPISNQDLQFLIAYELVIRAVLFSFLVLRSWKIVDLGFGVSLKETLTGVGLALVAYISYVIVWAVVSSLFPNLVQSIQNTELVSPDLNIITIILVSIVNPVFEEVFVCAYIITRLKTNRNIWIAINISILIRLLYHLYQGAGGVISIVPLGFIFAYWYARTGRLWPLIVAHAIFDFIGLYIYSA